MRPMPRALDCLVPACDQLVALRSLHRRLEAALGAPQIGNFLEPAPETGRQSGQVRGTERCRLGHLGAHDRHAGDVRLKLQQQIILCRAAVDSDFGQRLLRIALHCCQYIGRLECDRLQRGARDMRLR